MVDIETLGTKANSTIFQIAAIAFDIKTGEHISEFHHIADIGQNQTMSVTGDTIKWWLNTNKELLTKLLNSGYGSSEELLIKFYNWIYSLTDDMKNVYLWGNGILFDNKMIETQLEALDMNYPIYYKNDRDMRTIVDLTATRLGISETELKEKFNDDNLVAHDAFDDVRYQIRLVTGCYQILTL